MACRIVTGKQNPLSCVLPSIWLQKGLKPCLQCGKSIKGRNIPPCLDSLGLKRPKNTHTIQPDFSVHHPGRQKTNKNCFFQNNFLLKFVSKLLGTCLVIRFTKENASTTFFSLDFKNWIFISSVLQFISLKSHGERVEVTCFYTPSQVFLPGKTGYLNPKSSQSRHRRAGEGNASYGEAHPAATSSVESTGVCFSQFSGCLRDPGFPISSLIWHIYIGSGSAECVTSGISR